MYKILHIDDNHSDIILTRMAIEKIPFDITFESALNGSEGLERLKLCKKLPNLVLIDVNMPVMGGKEFLKKCKSTIRFKNIPVVILTTSDYQKDIEDCYSLKVDDYIIKEQDLDSFFKSINKLVTFWLGVNSNTTC